MPHVVRETGNPIRLKSAMISYKPWREWTLGPVPNNPLRLTY